MSGNICKHSTCNNKLPEGKTKYCSQLCRKRAKRSRYLKKQMALGTPRGIRREAARNKYWSTEGMIENNRPIWEDVEDLLSNGC